MEKQTSTNVKQLGRKPPRRTDTFIPLPTCKGREFAIERGLLMDMIAESGLRVADIARETGISYATVKNYAGGVSRRPQGEASRRIFEYFGWFSGLSYQGSAR